MVSRLKTKALLAGALMVTGPAVDVAFAAGSEIVAQDAELTEVAVLGSRRSQRTVAEAAVPVDVISSSEVMHQGVK